LEEEKTLKSSVRNEPVPGEVRKIWVFVHTENNQRLLE